MKQILIIAFSLLILLSLFSCSSNGSELASIGPSIIVHPQYSINDRIEGVGWEPGKTVGLEIDDPSNGVGADYSASQEVAPSATADTLVRFFTGADWDLEPGHVVTLSDGETSIRYVVVNLMVESIDMESDVISGYAEPGSEVMVWTEAPYFHELLVTADNSGSWSADYSGITDITGVSFGAAAQFDSGTRGSRTQVNWAIGHMHIEANYTHSSIGFYNFSPNSTLAFQIFASQGGDLLHAETLETDEFGTAAFANLDQNPILEPGTYILAHDDTTMQEAELEMRPLTIDLFDPERDLVAGHARAGDIVLIEVFDHENEEVHSLEVNCSSDNTWAAAFESDLHQDMEVFARVSDDEGDESAVVWVRE